MLPVSGIFKNTILKYKCTYIATRIFDASVLQKRKCQYYCRLGLQFGLESGLMITLRLMIRLGLMSILELMTSLGLMTKFGSLV